MTPYLRAANVKDGVLDLSDVKEMNFAPPEQQIFSLKQGDVLVTEGSGSLGSIGASAVWSGEMEGPICFQNTLLRLRPRPVTDSRFLAWWCRHAFADGIFASVALGANIFHVSAERVRALPLHYVSLSTQRAIADYLDRETARIDALIEKKKRMIQLLEERFQRLIDDVVWSEVDQPVPLMRRVQWNRPIMYGIVLPGPDVPEGVPIVKGGDVAARRLSPDRLARTTPEIEAPYARARLHERDLVFAIRGGIGDVELVPPELEGANITQDVARVAPAADVDPMWLGLVLRSAEVRRQVEQRVTGATIKGLNIWDLKRVCVPPSGGRRQRADLARLSVEESRVCRLVDALGSQSSLLAEHRQALITAAVTGELEVPGMAA
jgi:type I restriction enzyme S subunit